MPFNSPSSRSVCTSPALLLSTAALALAISPATQAVVRFVDPSSPGPFHNGTSWTQAHTTLNAALSVAASGDEIWVANGTHLPTTTTDRNISFEIPSGVKVFGGFAGFGTNESLLSQRDILANRTILSGNIGSVGTNADNSFTVVSIPNGAASSTRLDGVFIVAGNANGGGSLNLGAGMDVGGNPTIRNCVFVGNTAATNGGAVFCDTTICNFVNCVFSGNTAGGGAALSVLDGRAALLNCTVNANTSTGGNGAAVQYINGDGFPNLVRNSIIFNNTGPNGSVQQQQISVTNSSLALSRSCIQGLDGSLGGTGNIGGAPRFIDANGADNVTGTVDDNLALRGGSAGIDAGDNAMVQSDSDDLDEDGNITEPGPFDLDYQPRFHDDIVNNTGAGVGPMVDMGAYEFKQPVRVICVNDNATGNGFGATWENAYTSLQDALFDAGDVKDPAPEVIWVAQGTYKPVLPAGRAATFAMIAGVKIYGGFDDSGTQGSISQRTPDVVHSILSGDIGAVGNNVDNCFHVVTANGANFLGSIRPTLDGFVITQGNCNGAGVDMAGGGIRCFGATSADPIIRNCKFVGNTGTIASAADSLGSDPSFINCVFSGNTQTGGGVIRLGNPSTPSLLHCTIANNAPGGVSISGSPSVTITNCIAVNNGNLSQSDQIGFGSGTLAMDYCCVQNLTGSLGGTGNISVLPFFVDPNGPDDALGTPDDDYNLLQCSSVIDAGDFNALPTDSDDLDGDSQTSERLPLDLASLDRHADDLGIFNSGLGAEPADMGAYEFQDVSGGTCPADVFPTRGGNGVVNVEDLLEVIASWGTCNGCTADIAPSCGNGEVNVSDLLVVIAMWGQCP